MIKTNSWGFRTSCAAIASLILLGVGLSAGVEPDTSDVSGSASSSAKSLTEHGDYVSVADLAIALSYPIYRNGTSADPRSRIPGGPTDKDLASDLYKNLKRTAWEKSVRYGNSLPAWPGEAYANCAAFTATAIIHTVDPNFPGNFTNEQRDYVMDGANG